MTEQGVKAWEEERSGKMCHSCGLKYVYGGTQGRMAIGTKATNIPR
jgi:hypothetical protein